MRENDTVDHTLERASAKLLPIVFGGMMTLATFIGIRILSELSEVSQSVQTIQVDVGGMKVEIKNLKEQVQRRNDR